MYKKTGLLVSLIIILASVFWTQDVLSDGMLIPTRPNAPAFAVKYHHVNVIGHRSTDPCLARSARSESIPLPSSFAAYAASCVFSRDGGWYPPVLRFVPILLKIRQECQVP